MSFQRNGAAVRRFARISRIAAWLQALPNKLTPPPFRLLQLGSAFWQSRALYVAAELDIATQLADESCSAADLARRLQTHPDATYRLLRFLASMGVFREVAPARFQNNKLSNCLRQGHDHNVRAMILLHNSSMMTAPWCEQLTEGIRTGDCPFERWHGQEFFSYLSQHPSQSQLFNDAMACVEALTGDSFASDVAWSQCDRLIDVGGGHGAKALAILRRHPQLRALVVDQPHVIESATRVWLQHQAEPDWARLEFRCGDLFGQLPEAQSSRDIYLLSAVLHAFDDAACVQALRNLCQVTRPQQARIAVLEVVMPESNADLARASFDMQMLMASRGHERTLAQWQDLAQQSGLLLTEVVALQSFASLLIFTPPPN